MESIFNDGFQPLTCDEDVLLFGKNTFTVGKFRGLVLEIIKAEKSMIMNPLKPPNLYYVKRN